MNTAVEKKSLLAQVLTPDLEKELATKETARGFTLDHIVKSGRENPDSSIGVYAPDALSYKFFGKLFNPIIEKYHGHKVGDKHKKDLEASSLEIKDLDPSEEFVVSTRIRVGRNLSGFCFTPCISERERKEVEKRSVEALKTLTGDLGGNYYPLYDMDEEVRAKLVADHFLFKQGDRFLESAGVNRHWPKNRGIFHSQDKQFLTWVNEEDHLRIISMEKGGNVYSVFERLSRAIKTLEKKLHFAYSDDLGYLSSCPSNLGTAMRASVHIKLPKLSQSEKFKSICESTGLSIRGIHGEHSDSESGIFDISNKRRLGISEVEAVNVLCQGVSKLIKEEQVLSA